MKEVLNFPKRIRKVLIANRGEIACRILRYTKKANIYSVAIYSAIDRFALHTKLADEAFCVGPAPAKESYLNIEKIISIAKKAEVDAIHPGYGFLSENPEFAEACETANIIFIGPSSKTIRKMGSKTEAKSFLSKFNFPLIPGYFGEKQDTKSLVEFANSLKLPILFKAAAGGGGKGMRIARSYENLVETIESAKRESQAFFGDNKLLIEPFFEYSRHIEVQIAADKYGNIIHLFDRDCSSQRRYQKLIEEAPAPNLSISLRESLHQTALSITKAINYSGVGTIEFLLDADNNFYFMEMNTRLQVEHPVTEFITGIDLVELQFNIAEGEELPSQLDLSQIKGHSIEARIYAENPHQQFAPSSGYISFIHEPNQIPDIRIDSWIKEGDFISTHYDALLSKLIVYAPNREIAVDRLLNSLRNYTIGNINTNISFLYNYIQSKNFRESKNYTQLIDKRQSEYLENKPEPTWLLLISGLYAVMKLMKQLNDSYSNSPWHQNDAWSMFQLPSYKVVLKHDKDIYCLNIIKQDFNLKVIVSDFKTFEIYNCQIDEENIYFEMDSCIYKYQIKNFDNFLYILGIANHKPIEILNNFNEYNDYNESNNSLCSNIPGTIVNILVNIGEIVNKGDKLLVVEAMKMEHAIFAPYKGLIKKFYFKNGDQVKEGQELMLLEKIT